MSAQLCSFSLVLVLLRARHRVRVGQRAGRRLDDACARDHEHDETEQRQHRVQDEVRGVEVEERGAARVEAVGGAEGEQQQVDDGLQAREPAQPGTGGQAHRREDRGDQEQDAVGGVEPQGEHGVRHLSGEARAPARDHAGDADSGQDHRLARDERRRDAPQESLVGHGGDGVALVVAPRGGIRAGAAAGLIVVRPLPVLVRVRGVSVGVRRVRHARRDAQWGAPAQPRVPRSAGPHVARPFACRAVHVSQRTGRSGRRTLRRRGRSGSR